MKTVLIIAILQILSQISAAGELARNTILANTGDFVLVSDVQDSEVRVFLSYTGKGFDHCGVAIRAQSLFDIEDLDERISIVGMSKKKSRIEDGRIVIEVEDLDKSSHGEDFWIRSKNGESLQDAISPPSTSTFRTHAIVEILSCK